MSVFKGKALPPYVILMVQKEGVALKCDGGISRLSLAVSCAHQKLR